jgi:tetratricopeptide (TPR) repeat protein
MHRRLLSIFVVMAVAATAALSTRTGAAGAAADVTFHEDIAPIVFAHCATCHRPDGAAPFSLVSYDDARRHARQMAEVTRSRYMPPWKPEPGHGEFVGARRLTADQIDLFQRWADGGALEGSRASAPRAPSWPSGWQVGEPDLVLTLPEYQLAAAGDADVFRNFVVDVPDIGTRYVRGIEFRPGTRVIHHANIFVDRSGTAGRLDDEDPAPGYQGLIPHSAVFPEGHFLGWTPGQAPPLEPADLAWRLDGGNQLLVQLHMQPSGKTERLRPSLGLFFSDRAPTRTPTILRLGRQSIDIAPGNPRYTTTDSFVLPVDAEVHAVQPHAHYRAREVTGWAELPDGTRRPLLAIRSWDFKWQDQYRYASPFWLPAGTTLHAEYLFDNSAANPRNPQPPGRVLWGFRSADEMGDLWVQLMTRSEADRERLEQQAFRKMTEESIVGLEVQIGVRPDYVALRNDVALLYLEVGQPARAVPHFMHVARLEPASAAAHFNLATALEASGRFDDAVRSYRAALARNPRYARAKERLAPALVAVGRDLLAAGRSAEAVPALEEALALRDDLPEAHYLLAQVLDAQNRPEASVDHLRRAMTVKPDWPPALGQLAWLLATESSAPLRNPAEAIRLATRAAELTQRKDPEILDTLAAAYAASGRFAEAVAVAEAARALQPPPALAAQLEARLRLYRSNQPIIVRR